MRSIEALAATPGIVGLVEALSPTADALAAQRARMATTEDGRPRLDRGVGFTPDASLPAVDTVLFGSVVVDLPSIGAGAVESFDIPVEGAVAGDVVAVGPPAALATGLVLTRPPIVTGPDTVTVEIKNDTASPINPASAVWKARVFP